MNNYGSIPDDNRNDDNRNDYNSPLLIHYNIRKHFLKNFWKFLIIIGAYYSLPSLQFVFFQAHDANVHCYYNKKCKHDLGELPAFNNVISNIGYILFGIIYLYFYIYHY